MRKADVSMQGKPAGILEEIEKGKLYRFTYFDDYSGLPVSLTMPIRKRIFEFDRFPPFFDGLLPEGVLLEALLKRRKIDRHDYFSQIVAVGEDLVGAVTVREANDGMSNDEGRNKSPSFPLCKRGMKGGFSRADPV